MDLAACRHPCKGLASCPCSAPAPHLDAGQGLAFQPFKEGAPGGGHVAEASRRARGIQRGHGVPAAGHAHQPTGGGQPTGDLLAAINRDFGSFEKFKEEFANAGATQFGSGWAWLVLKDGKLAVQKTPNADLPMKHNAKALLTMDVWEHAYYIDYRNARPKYIEVFLDKLANWDFALENLKKG